MQDVYVTEREGQIDFYKSYLPLIDNDLDLEDVLGIYSKKPPHFNEEMNCYLALYVQDILL